MFYTELQILRTFRFGRGVSEDKISVYMSNRGKIQFGIFINIQVKK